MTNALAQRETNGLTSPTTNEAIYAPRVDVLETPEGILLLADLPGVRPEDLDLHFENGELTLHGRCERRGGEFLTREYGVGNFYRAFTIGDEIDAEKISAEMKNGVLTVRLPRSEAAKPKRIAVKSE